DVYKRQGLNRCSIWDCYFTGEVVGSSLLGGVVGVNEGYLTHCYCACKIQGKNKVGGLVGHQDYEKTISHSYWDIETSGVYTSAGGEGKTTSEMKRKNTYKEWDFNDVWTIKEGMSYPTLKWQYKK
ncbi:MAG: hypothetical protein N3G21_12740, partial [Candidatus Hydrogenedentes bacterium]|nr:hypothetical protein [Candidatus Hydrogenedentota bacterium]